MTDVGHWCKGNINRYGRMGNDLCMDEVVVVESTSEKYNNARQKQWHGDAVAVPTHLKAVFSLFHNYYHPDGLFKAKERKRKGVKTLMGTKSTITFYLKDIPFVKVYQCFDGYPYGVGRGLCDWLRQKALVNGINSRLKNKTMYANGVGDLVAQYIHDFKKEIGGLYIYPVNHDTFADFHYSVIIDDDINLPKCGETLNNASTIRVTTSNGEEIFCGKIEDYYEFANNYKKNIGIKWEGR